MIKKLVLAVAVVLTFVTQATAQQHLDVYWESVPVGPFGTKAPAHRYCNGTETIQHVYEITVLDGNPPYTFCVYVNGPWELDGSPAFDVVGWMRDYGLPKFYQHPRYGDEGGRLCWDTDQLWQLAPNSYRAWYTIRLALPTRNYLASQYAEAYWEFEHEVYSGQYAEYWFAGCEWQGVYLPIIMKE